MRKIPNPVEDFEITINEGFTKIFKCKGNKDKVIHETNTFLKMKGLWNGRKKRK